MLLAPKDRAGQALLVVVDARGACCAVDGWEARIGHVALPAADGPERVARGDLPAGGDAAREGLHLRGHVGAELVRVEPLGWRGEGVAIVSHIIQPAYVNGEEDGT